MSKSCENFCEEMPRALLDDLNPEARQTLEAHLTNCPACRLEWELCRTTVRELQSIQDVAVPRHFFVHPGERTPTPWRLFQQLSSGWQVATALAILLMTVGAVMIISSIRFQANQGVYSFSFGKPLPAVNDQSSGDKAMEKMRGEMLAALEIRLQKERLQTIRWIEKELIQSNNRISQQQGRVLKASLTQLETRLNDRLVSTGAVLEARSDRELADLYATFQAQRQQDLLQVSAGLNRVVVAGEVKEKRTDAILDTLLQVAQLKLQ